MKLIESFGKRYGYQQEVHLAFVITTGYKQKVLMEIFVEASVDKNGIRSISLRENGTHNNILEIERINKEELHELIIQQL
tara:strand:- start:630 stop:869 length:240 start_codon:yes stop_codon:yes gene_type:complete